MEISETFLFRKLLLFATTKGTLITIFKENNYFLCVSKPMKFNSNLWQKWKKVHFFLFLSNTAYTYTHTHTHTHTCVCGGGVRVHLRFDDNR